MYKYTYIYHMIKLTKEQAAIRLLLMRLMIENESDLSIKLPLLSAINAFDNHIQYGVKVPNMYADGLLEGSGVGHL